MDKIINLEIRQTDSNSVRENGDWSTILSKPVILNNNDTLSINKVFIDTVSNTDGKIVIENDIIATMSFYLYVTSIQQQGVALGSDGKNYYQFPTSTTGTPLHDIDGHDFILCQDQAPPTVAEQASAVNMQYVTKIKVRSKVSGETSKKFMGDSTGVTPCFIGYYDKNGAQQSFYFDVPYRSHIPNSGVFEICTTSVIMDATKGFFITQDMTIEYDAQNVSNKLKNFSIAESSTPTQNYLQPVIIEHDIKIPGGSYTSDNMISLLNNSFQSNQVPNFGHTDMEAPDFPVNKLLRRITGCVAPKLVSTQTTTTSTRIIIPEGGIDWLLGSNLISINYDAPSKKFYFENLHMPIYDTAAAGAIATTYQTDGALQTKFFVGKNSGINIHSWAAKNNDPTLQNYNQSFDFWNSKLGFIETDITCKSIMSPPLLINGVEYYTPVFTNHLAGQSTTTAKAILDNAVVKATTPYLFQPMLNIYNTSDLTVPVVASVSKLDAVSLEYGYFLVEINNGLSSELIGATDINRTISCIVNRYYSLGTFTSGDISGSLTYVHQGPSIFLKNFNVRILDSNKNLAQNLEADNSIFISIIRGE